MYFKFLTLSLSLLLSAISFGQDRLEGNLDTATQVYSSNNIYIELGGKGLFYSVNYERKLFSLGEKMFATGSLGFSLFPGMTKVQNSMDVMLPFSISIHKHLKKSHFLVFGTGTTFYRYMINDIEISNENIDLQPLIARLKPINEFFGHVNLEYRHQKPKGGFMFKAGITPLFFKKMQNFQGINSAQLSGNIGIGYGF